MIRAEQIAPSSSWYSGSSFMKNLSATKEDGNMKSAREILEANGTLEEYEEELFDQEIKKKKIKSLEQNNRSIP